jgi:hypothetical protein
VFRQQSRYEGLSTWAKVIFQKFTLGRVTARKAGRPKKDNQIIDNAQNNQLHTLTPIILENSWSFLVLLKMQIVAVDNMVINNHKKK